MSIPFYYSLYFRLHLKFSHLNNHNIKELKGQDHYNWISLSHIVTKLQGKDKRVPKTWGQCVYGITTPALPLSGCHFNSQSLLFCILRINTYLIALLGELTEITHNADIYEVLNK